MNESMAQQAK